MNTDNGSIIRCFNYQYYPISVLNVILPNKMEKVITKGKWRKFGKLSVFGGSTVLVGRGLKKKVIKLKNKTSSA